MAGATGRPVIIRRKKVVHGHHGGSWKIALADFMTALMALFLVMWILSSSGKSEREAVAEYFRTPLVVAVSGDKATSSASPIPGGGADPVHTDGEQARIDLRTQTRPSDEQRRFFMDLQRRIESAVEADPVLRELRPQLRFDLTQEGLRIQVLDTERRPMFDLGSDRMAPYMGELLQTLAPLLNELPNDLSISGHTDSLAYANGSRGYSNWELSTDRANASRRELVAGGFASEKLLRVAGYADRVPLQDAEASAAMNRRIELVVLYPEVSGAIRAPALTSGMGLPSLLREGQSPASASGREVFTEGLRQALGGAGAATE